MTRMLAERPGRGIWLSPLISGSAIVAPTPPVSVLLCSPASDCLRGVCSECRIQKRWHLEAIAQSTSLGALDSSLRADEQTSMQVRLRCHPRLGPAPGHPRRVEYESAHCGALQSLAVGAGQQSTDIGPTRTMGRAGTLWPRGDTGEVPGAVSVCRARVRGNIPTPSWRGCSNVAQPLGLCWINGKPYQDSLIQNREYFWLRNATNISETEHLAFNTLREMVEELSD
jgi:hypothetical protein